VSSILGREIVEKLFADAKAAAGNADRGLTRLVDFGSGGREQVADVRRIERGTDGSNRYVLLNLACRRENRCAAEAMPDQQGRGRVVRA
jgi:hypothetical protein